MVYSSGFLLVTLALQLRFSTLPPASLAYSHAQYAAGKNQPMPFASEALAYHSPTRKVAPEFGRELYLPSGATDSSALHTEAAHLFGHKDQQSGQDGFFQFWDSVSDELKQAWHSIRAMFR